LAVALYLVAMGATGVWGPVKQAYFHQEIPSEQRATVVSFDSLVSSAGSMLGQTGLGRLAQTYSLGAGYVVGGLVTAVAWPVVLVLRRRNDPSDIIVGTAGQPGACAAQGLPTVSSVDTTAQAAEV
jgi:predicted MFS family arabinose efflux permease